jgi:hypothetical protein
MIEFLQQFLGTIASPQGAFESLPHSASWIAFFQDALRGYKLINLTYYIGGLLLFIALLKTVYDYIQGYRVARQVVAIGVASFLFAALATPPRDECVKDTGYPCLVEKRLELKQGLNSITYAEEKLDWKIAKYENGVYKLTDAPGQQNQRQITIKTKDLSHVRYLSYEYPAGFTPVWDRIEDFWWSTYATANTALAAMVAKYAESANETKNTLFNLIKDIFATNTTKGLLDEVLPFVGIAGGLKRAGVAALAGGVSGATDVPLAMLSNSVRTMAILIASAPVALILTYHVLAALSGFILYLIIFLAPIFIGLSALFGLPILSFPARLLVSIFVVPILSSTVLGTSLHLIYQYTDDLQNFVESNTDKDTKDAKVADFYADYEDMATASPVLAYYLSQLAAYQLSNLYACMKDGGFLIIDESGKPTYLENPPSPSVDKEVCGQDGSLVKDLMSGNTTSYTWIPGKGSILESFSKRLPQKVLNLGISDPDFSKERFVAELYSIVGLGTAEGSNPSALLSPVGRERLARFISKWGVLLNAEGLNPNVPEQTVRRFAEELATQFGIKDTNKFYGAVSFLLFPHVQTGVEGYVPSYLNPSDNPRSPFWQKIDTSPQAYIASLKTAKGGIYKNLVVPRDGFASLYLANVISHPPIPNWNVINPNPSNPSYTITRGLLAYLDRWMVADRLGLDPLKGTGAMGFMAIQTLAFTLVALILALIAMGSVWTLTAQVLGSKAFGGLQELLTGVAPGVGSATSARASGFRRAMPSQGGQRKGP